MLKIGITGGIGSGKTTVCRIFQILGIPVFNADEVAKKSMESNPILVSQIKSRFGEEVYFSTGQLNRKYLSEIVFKDSDALNELNGLVHPISIQAFEVWSSQQTSAYCLREAAILFESGAYRSCDYTILVFSPEALRIERVMKRSQISEDAVRSIMNKQMPEEEKKKLADFLLINDESNAILPQVLKYHRHFTQMNNERNPQ